MANLRPTALAVLAYLDAMSDDRGIVSEPMLDIGLNIGRSVSAVRNAIDRLDEHGAITKLRIGKRTSKGVYQVNELGIEILRSTRSQKPYSHTAPKPLSDVFRSPALGFAGQLYQAAQKEIGLTRKQVLGLGIVRSTETLLKYAKALSSLPHPLITVSEDPDVPTRKLYVFHEMDDAAELANLEHLQSIPDARPKTHEQHQEETVRRKQGYANFLGGIVDMEELYDTEVKPYLVTDPKHPGCQLFIGRKSEAGYGVIKHGRVHFSAHRIAWVAQLGEVRPGYQIHHWCGERACTFIGHLDELTAEDHKAVHLGRPTRVWYPNFWKGKQPSLS